MTAFLRVLTLLPDSLPFRSHNGCGIEGRRWRKLQALLADAVTNVPYYRETYRTNGIKLADIRGIEDLEALPKLSKATLLDLPTKARVNNRYKLVDLVAEKTSGSTGEPFTVHLDANYLVRRNHRFVRGLLTAGYRPGHKIMLVTDREGHPKRARAGWHYCSLSRPTMDIADYYLRIRPSVLYGCTTPLRLLAEFLGRKGCRVPSPRVIITTAEALDSATRTLLESTFCARVVDFYGLTEMGLVAWQRPGHDAYVMAEDAVITEFVPITNGKRRFRMLMTNLDLRATPLIRFDCGDVAVVETSESGRQVVAFDGRVVDALVCRDGTSVSPYRVTLALEGIPLLRRYKITQRSLQTLDVKLEAAECARGGIANRVALALNDLLGPELRLNMEFVDRLVPDGTRKFRPVESTLEHGR